MFLKRMAPFSQLPKSRAHTRAASSAGDAGAGARTQTLRRLSPAIHISDIYTEVVEQTRPLLARVLPLVAEIGQLQHLRQLIGFELGFAARMDATSLWSSAQTMNDGLLRDILEHYERPDANRVPPSEQMLGELSGYLDQMGFADPWKKVYIALPAPVPYVHAVLFAAVLVMMENNVYNPKISSLGPSTPSCEASTGASGPDALDGPAVLLGVMTVLQQVNGVLRQQFLALLGQYTRVLVGDHGVEFIEQQKKKRKIAGQGTVASMIRAAVVSFQALIRYGAITPDEAGEFVAPAILQDYL